MIDIPPRTPTINRPRLDAKRCMVAWVVMCLVAPLVAAQPPEIHQGENGETYDVVIYGGTAAAVTAAVQTRRMDQNVIIVSPDIHLGGLSAGGLGFTDTGNQRTIGGIAREFYAAVYQHYQDPSAWNLQNREDFNRSELRFRKTDTKAGLQWAFEPHVAEDIFDAMVRRHQIPVVRNAWLDRDGGVETDGERIVSITTLDGQTFRGRQFIDATYEGDLLAAAGVDSAVGREAASQYDEPNAGVRTGVFAHHHHFKIIRGPIDPYIVPGDPLSGLIARISDQPPGEVGSGDHRVQAYCYRVCMTDHAPNRVPFPKPENYDPSQYELLLRCFEAGWRGFTGKFDPVPNHKTDTNNRGPVSFDNIGYNYDYPEASYDRRREIIAEHETYQKGMLFFAANDPRVPTEIRQELADWGLAKDEFIDNQNWPHQLYIREARRMVGQFVMTERHLRGMWPVPHGVAMGSYGVDSHNVQRYVASDGTTQNEGDIAVRIAEPYPIAMEALMPKASQCVNLTVPVCVSATHLAFGSIRMEPVFMMLGQSAATISALANEGDGHVQSVRYDDLRPRLIADNQILQLDSRR